MRVSALTQICRGMRIVKLILHLVGLVCIREPLPSCTGACFPSTYHEVMGHARACNPDAKLACGVTVCTSKVYVPGIEVIISVRKGDSDTGIALKRICDRAEYGNDRARGENARSNNRLSLLRYKCIDIPFTASFSIAARFSTLYVLFLFESPFVVLFGIAIAGDRLRQ